MMFGLAHIRNFAGKTAGALLPLALALVMGTPAQAADLGKAAIPRTIIYPGQLISAEQIEVVAVTNPNLIEGYARSAEEVDGMITTRTLLPGRTIMVSALRKPYTVRRGDKALLIFDNGTLRITASGVPLGDGNIGDVIQVRNADSGAIVSGTVLADGTILVAQK